MSDENDESFTDDSYESKSKMNVNLSSLQKQLIVLKTKNKALQKEVTAFKHKRSIKLEKSNSVIIKRYSMDMNENLNNVFVSLYCKSTVSAMENLGKMADELAVKIQYANECIAEFNKNICTQILQEQQLHPSVKHVVTW